MATAPQTPEAATNLFRIELVLFGLQSHVDCIALYVLYIHCTKRLVSMLPAQPRGLGP